MPRRLAPILCILLAGAAPAAAAITWRADFEAGKPAPFEAAPPGAVSIVDAPEAAGTHAARVALPAGGAGRALLVRRPGKGAAEGADRTYAVRLRVPAALAPVAHDVVTFGPEGSEAPPVALVATGERLGFVTRRPEVKQHYGGTSARLSPGVWHRLVVRVVWSRDPARGLVQAWWDGDMFVAGVRGATLTDEGPGVWQVGLARAGAAPVDEVLLVDDAREATRVADVHPPFVPGAPGRMFRDVEFTRPGGVPLRLDAFVPAGRGPHPAAILVHGGGFVRGDKQSYVLPLFDVLARAGFACFTIDYRLAPEHKYPAAVDDIEAAVAWVHRNARRFALDPKRVILMGESASGYLVSLVGTRRKRGGDLAAVLPWYGPQRFALPAPGPDGTIPLPKEGALVDFFGITDTGPATAAKLRAASPIDQVHADMPPYLIVNSDDDTAPLGDSRRLCEAMKRVGATCDLFVTHAMGHGLGKWKEHPEEHRKVVDWLTRTLALPADRAAR